MQEIEFRALPGEPFFHIVLIFGFSTFTLRQLILYTMPLKSGTAQDPYNVNTCDSGTTENVIGASNDFIDLPQFVFLCTERATKSRGDDLSRLHRFEFHLQVVGGKYGCDVIDHVVRERNSSQMTGHPCSQSLRSFGQRLDPRGLWGNLVPRVLRLFGQRLDARISCFVTACIVLPQKSCGNKILVPPSLSWRPTAAKEPEDSEYEIASGNENEL